ncbi:MAG TPA: UDP-3-O-(3-hydroxymyristoyl)glucosamine N-acyltransferase [Vicinamibacterales bacterium]|nr:UDP-3-O-(3-hydroxymyristoyl)glucosamine N-acyltransferase [Vicinamibacterales bacterium]
MRLADLADRLGAAVEGDADVEITGVAPIEAAGPHDLTFVANPRYARYLESTSAAAVILGPETDGRGRCVLRAMDPYAAFVAALQLFDVRPRPRPGVHPTAVISRSAVLGPGAYVGPYVVVGDDVEIGAEARLFPNVVIYDGVKVGARFTAHAGAVVRECVEIGDDVTVQPGVVIGGDGFGFLPTGERPTAIPQIGRVVIGDCVDVGANTTIDRAAVGETRIGSGVKLDNLVMVAHGCAIGDGSMLAGQVGLAGSTMLGRRVMAGGQAGLAGHLTVGDGVRIAARAGVIGDVASGQTVAGFPAVEAARWRRVAAALLRLPDILRRLRLLERRAGGDEKT